MQGIEGTLRSIVQDTLDREALELYHLQLNKSCLKVYIQGKDSVSLDDCARISRAIKAKMEKKIEPDHNFGLEVSSPGINPHLFTQQHVRDAEGNTVKVRLISPHKGKQTYCGTLKLGPNGKNISIINGTKIVSFPLENVSQAILFPKPQGV